MEIPTPESPNRRWPPIRAALAELPTVTETLAHEAFIGGTPEPSWNDCQWGVARAATVIHGLSGLLALGSKWTGKQGWPAFLASQHEHIAAREARIAQLLKVIETKAAAEGIPIMPLKGAALLQFGLACSGTRPMADLDLLVPKEFVPGLSAMFAGLGYQPPEETWKHLTFEAGESPECDVFGEHRDRPIAIDLHVSVRERLADGVIDITSQVSPEMWRPGANSYPSRVALLRHLLLHAAGNMSVNWLRGIHVHDIATVARLLDETEWRELIDPGSEGATPWWALPPLRLAAAYGRVRVPRESLVALERACGRRLSRFAARATMSAVSASNARIVAVPAVVWSRSIFGMLRYVAARVFPEQAVARSYRMLGETRPYARGESWFVASQPVRLIKWLVNRPPRHGTVHAIRSAFLSYFGDIPPDGAKASRK